MWQAVWPTIRSAYRAVRARPSVAILSAFSLGTAIAACVVVVGLWDAVFLRALPYRDAQLLVHARSGTQLQDESGWTSEPDFLDYRRLSGPVFQDFAALYPTDVTYRAGDGAYAVDGVAASAEFLSLLGVTLLLGRTFTSAEDVAGAGEVVVLSHAFWMTHCAGDPRVIGTSLLLDDVPHTVLGVLPDGFALYLPGEAPARVTPDVWTPLRARVGRNPRSGRYLFVLGKLRAGVTPDMARARAAVLSAEIQRTVETGRADFLMRPVPLRDELVESSRTPLVVLLLSVLAVLLIACVNVGGLLIEQQSRRRAEFATRYALGATSGRVAGQLVAEAAWISVAATLLGVGLAVLLFHALGAVIPASVPRVGDALLSWRVIAATGGVTVVVVALTVWPPLARAKRGMGRLAESLMNRARIDVDGRRSLPDLQIAAQIALSIILLAGSGLALRSAFNILGVDLGFDPTGALTFEVTLPEARYGSDAQVTEFFSRFRDRLAGLPGVSSVGFANALPLSGGGMRTAHAPPGTMPAEWVESDLGVVSEAYFDALRVEVQSGRSLTALDGLTPQPVVMIDETIAQRLWPAGDAVGRTLSVRTVTSLKPFRTGVVDAEIVGVVRHIRSRTPARVVRGQVYVPHGHIPFRRMRFVLRATNPLGLAGSVRATLQALDPTVPVAAVQELDTYRRDAMAEYRFLAIVLVVFASLGASLAGVGVYSVVAFRVSARVREFGLRVALGASGGSIVWLVLRRSLLATALGLGVGIGGSLALGRLLGPRLFEVSPADPLILGSVGLAAAALTLLASWAPAARALSVDPSTCLTERI